MIIGIPKEIMHDEDRVAATPATCEKYVKDGHQVLVEAGAGEGAFFHDAQYEQPAPGWCRMPKPCMSRQN